MAGSRHHADAYQARGGEVTPHVWTQWAGIVGMLLLGGLAVYGLAALAVQLVRGRR